MNTRDGQLYRVDKQGQLISVYLLVKTSQNVMVPVSYVNRMYALFAQII